MTKMTKIALALAAISTTSVAFAQYNMGTPTELLKATTAPTKYYHINAITNKFAYTAGWRGQNVTVAVMDGGFAKNAEFASRVKYEFNATPSSGGIANTNTALQQHGTHVAGIIAASANTGEVVGIAPLANLALVRVFDNNGYGGQTYFNNGANFIVQNTDAKIVSMSLGSKTQFGQSGMQQMVSAGKLIVAAAGNTGAANPEWPARYATATWANNQIIAVGATDASGKLASYSNKAGDTANWFVVAPGSNIYSTISETANGYKSGTSMATPIVAGIAAEIYSKWKYLKAEQVAGIIFASSRRMGTATATTPDATYGWGMVCAACALQPVLSTKIIYNGGTQSISLSSTSMSAALIKTRDIEFDAVDGFGRNFTYNVADFVYKPTINETGNLFSQMDKTLTMIESSNKSGFTQHSYSDNSGISGFKFAGGELVMGYNQSPMQYFSVAQTNVLSAVTNHMSMVNTKHFGGLAFVNGDVKFKLGANSGENNMGILAAVEKEFGRGVMSLAVGNTAEQKQSFGTSGTGAMAIDGGNTTFVTLSGSYDVDHNMKLVGSVSYGSASTKGSGIVKSIDSVSAGWSLAAVKTNAFTDNDALAVGISQPLHVVGGSMNVEVATMNQETGELAFNTQNFDLKTAAQTDVEIGYSMKTSKTSKVQMNAIHKMNYQGEADSTMNVLGVRYITAF